MKKPMLVIAAAIPLVVIASIAVWQASGDDSRRQGALGGSELIALSWRGDWSADAEYAQGNVVSYDGSSYVAEGERLSTPEPECVECGWRRIAAPAPTSVTSPNGSFKLEVKDTGILLTGPSASVLLAADRLVVNTSKNVDLTVGTALGISVGANVLVNAGSNIAAKAGGTLSVESAAPGFVKSPTLTLGCSSGTPVARLGDRVNVGGGGYAGSAAPGPYPIIDGSPNVLAC